MIFFKKDTVSSKSEKRQLILAKYDGRCAYCGCFLLLSKITVDHIISKDGFHNKVAVGDMPFYLSHLSPKDINHFDNLNPSCHDCNQLKANLSLDAFKHKIKTSRWRLIGFRLKRRYKKGSEYLFYYELVILSRKN